MAEEGLQCVAVNRIVLFERAGEAPLRGRQRRLLDAYGRHLLQARQIPDPYEATNELDAHEGGPRHAQAGPQKSSKSKEETLIRHPLYAAATQTPGRRLMPFFERLRARRASSFRRPSSLSFGSTKCGACGVDTTTDSLLGDDTNAAAGAGAACTSPLASLAAFSCLLRASSSFRLASASFHFHVFGVPGSSRRGFACSFSFVGVLLPKRTRNQLG